jgi:hypothetical protein
VFAPRDRDHLETARVLRPDLVDHILGHDEIGQVDPGDSGLGGETARDIIGGNDSLPNEHVDHAPFPVEIRPGLLDLAARHKTDVAQKIENVFFVRLGHG